MSLRGSQKIECISELTEAHAMRADPKHLRMKIADIAFMRALPMSRVSIASSAAGAAQIGTVSHNCSMRARRTIGVLQMIVSKKKVVAPWPSSNLATNRHGA
jgi:hypothetical protein